MSEPDHREFLYMNIGWMLMDLRQDIEFSHMFMDEEYPVDRIIARLSELQQEVADYADIHFLPKPDRDL